MLKKAVALNITARMAIALLDILTCSVTSTTSPLKWSKLRNTIVIINQPAIGKSHFLFLLFSSIMFPFHSSKEKRIQNNMG